MTRIYTIFILLVCSLAMQGYTQVRQITGTVVDRSGETLIGVTVLEEGTTHGTITDINGAFSIEVSVGTNLVFTYVGMTRRVLPATAEPMMVVMEDDYLQLDGVQVVAYGTRTRREISGAIGRVDTEAIQRNAGTSIISGLAGRSAGLDVATSADGRSASIRIRGVSSIRSGSNPLIVVDGMPTNQGISDINPEDILSIDILKDAAASVLYGSRAANGVILITTRQGETGETRINVNYQRGILTPSNTDIPVMNADQWRTVYTTAARNRFGDAALFSNPSDGHDGFYAWDQYDSNGNLLRQASNFETDWFGMIMDDNGSFDRLSLTASGGSDRTTFYASLLYRHDNGYLQASNQQRGNLRLNLTHQITDWLRAGFQLSGNIVDIDPTSGMEGFGTALTSALPIYPLMSPANPDRYWYRFAVAPNFVAEHDLRYRFNRGHNFLNSAFLEVEPIENLVVRSEWQSDYRANQSRNYTHPFANPFGTGVGGGDGMITSHKNENHTLNANNTVRYAYPFGMHKIDVLAGINFMQTQGGSSTAFQEQIAHTFLRYGSGFDNREERVASGWGERRFASGIARLNYSFQNKYFQIGRAHV